MKRYLLLATCLLLVGCNIDWTGESHVHPDPDGPRPVPVVNRAFRMLIVEETADRTTLSAAQQSIFTSTVLRKYLADHAAKLSDGSNGYRFLDKDDIPSAPGDLRATAEQYPAGSYPWLWCTDGENGLSCPLPSSVDELLAKLKPFAEGQ